MTEKMKPTMTEKMKPTMEQLQQKIEDMEKAAAEYKHKLEETVRSRPFESVAMFFAGGVVLGILLGVALARRH